MSGHGTHYPGLTAKVGIGHRWDSKGFFPLMILGFLEPEKLLEKLQPHCFQLVALILSWYMQTKASAFPALFFPCTAQAPGASSCEL